jgi:hypothetical protein
VPGQARLSVRQSPLVHGRFSFQDALWSGQPAIGPGHSVLTLRSPRQSFSPQAMLASRCGHHPGGWRSPVGCWAAASTSSRRSRPPPPPLKKARPGALVFPLEPATRPPVLTEQPGPDAIVMRTPPRARMGACEPTPTEVVRVSSPPDPAPVLAGVKVVRPAGRSTLTRLWPADPAITRSQQAPQPGPDPLAPLTGPDLMGAETMIAMSDARQMGRVTGQDLLPGYQPSS